MITTTENETTTEPAPAARPRTLNPYRFLNATACREFLLEQARTSRAHRYTRVGSKALEDLNAMGHQKMISHVRSLPSKGQTI